MSERFVRGVIAILFLAYALMVFTVLGLEWSGRPVRLNMALGKPLLEKWNP